MPARLKIRLVVPIVLVVAIVLVSVGCWYEPGRVIGQNVSELAGPAGSNKPIRPGVTRAQVVSILGQPASQTGNTMEYQWVEELGRWRDWCSIAAVPSFQQDTHTATLEFNNEGILTNITFDHSYKRIGE